MASTRRKSTPPEIIGGMMLGGTPAEFGKFLVAETDKWAKVIHDADLKLMGVVSSMSAVDAVASERGRAVA